VPAGHLNFLVIVLEILVFPSFAWLSLRQTLSAAAFEFMVTAKRTDVIEIFMIDFIDGNFFQRC
jgi:hypothetical protein